MQMHYKRDTDITWFTQDGIFPHRNCYYFIIIPSNKMKGYNLQQPHCTSSSHSHSLSHTVTEIVLQCYNTIHNHFAMPSFYNENTMGKYHRFPKYHGKIPWVHKSPIIYQVMTLKLLHFTRHFS